MEKVAVYLFRVKVLSCDNIWSCYSNTKSVKIVSVREFEVDSWYRDIVGDKINILDNQKVSFAAHNTWHSVYSNKIVKQNEVYEWTLKLNKFDGANLDSGWYFFIGVCKDDTKFMQSKRNSYADDGLIYGGKKGILHTPSNAQYPNAKFMQRGDILKLKLDLQK